LDWKLQTSSYVKCCKKTQLPKKLEISNLSANYANLFEKKLCISIFAWHDKATANKVNENKTFWEKLSA